MTIMGHALRITLAMAVLLSAAGTGLAETVSIRLGDGSRWRGEVSDRVRLTIDEHGVERTLEGRLVEAAEHYIIIETDVAGRTARKTIFKGDIQSMKTTDVADRSDEARSDLGARETRAQGDEAPSGSPTNAPLTDRGVFVLPLEGMVGTKIRHQEIRKIGEHADEYGPGQIIVLIIETNGGMVFEEELIIEEIWKLRERHRVVAWVRKAISAGAATAMACHEIYFVTEGTAGSVTTITGDLQSVPEEEVQDEIDFLVETAERAGHSEHVARAMKLKKYMCSYDKDPVTGEVTFYGDLSGEYVLSDAEHNLTFTSSQAIHCGFADGIADTGEELAEHLDLPAWHEMSDYGREIAEEWRETVDRAQEEVRRLVTRLNYAGSGSGDPMLMLGKRIQILKKIMRWQERAPVALRQIPLPPKATLEREIEELRKQLADMKRRRRGY